MRVSLTTQTLSTAVLAQDSCPLHSFVCLYGGCFYLWGLPSLQMIWAGVFVTTVVAGTIAIICPFDCMQRPFLRDVIFFVAALFYTFVVLWDKKITKFEAIGFIIMYVVYVLVVVIGRFIYTRNKNRTTQLKNDNSSGVQNPSMLDEDAVNSSIQIPETLDEDALESAEIEEERQHLLHSHVHSHVEAGPDLSAVISPWGRFFTAINPIDTENWSQMKIYKKVYEVFKSPIMFFLVITIPVVDYEEENHNWNRYLNALQCFTGPVFCIFATKVGFNMMGSFPVWALVMLLAFCLAVLVFITSKNDTRPKIHSALAYLGFLVAVIWIYSIANEIVNILQTFGIAFSISSAILGLTFLAWGNSIGDFIADIAMARQGYPRMGISACFGGPLFNLLLGVGIPFTIGTIKNGDYQLKLTLEELVLAAFLAFSLVTSLIIVTASKFRMSRPYGLYLMILYVVFLVVAILTETGTIKADIN
ncbi:hypothetical protein CHS0354_034308 [Potamilus streckersoni]|uniref:Sodium/calcium exchanger membrane region domain-containing protein n=1 Tax=Potamilus streckersoni TaxID=2493646 RepID=A0AAE0SI83_9BIVA|nr:hypothetical protein CHS0354_034308 [Potamilus streckersoni]